MSVSAGGLERYIAFMEGVGKRGPEGVRSVVTTDIHFRDPFNDLRGIDAFEAVITDMYRSVADLEIVVTHASLQTPRHAQDAVIASLRWNLSGKLAAFGGRPWQVTGYSELELAADERIRRHFDYWDAASGLYELLPLIGPLCRQVRQRLALKD